MSETFQFRLITPVNELVSSEVTEVVLPAFDGECGILADHENFVGLLGTGALKLVSGGNDYWYMVSQGLFQVEDGELSVLAEHGEEVKSIDEQSAKKEIADIDELLNKEIAGSARHQELSLKRDRIKARLDVHHRTTSVH